MFKIRYKSHHDVGNVISKFTKNFKASKEDFISLLEGENVSKQLALYFHTPYCDKICSFCNMNRKQLDNDLEEYTKYICDEIKKYGAYKFCKTSEVDVVFFGGGTPTTLTPDEMDTLIKGLFERFDLSEIKEFTVEAGRPDTINREMLEVLKKNNVDRISINPQSMNDETLQKIGRNHSIQDIIDTFHLAREVGFDNINMDIILGLVDEDLSMVRNTLDKIKELSPESLTVHTLAVKRTSKLKENLEDYELAQYEEMVKMINLAKEYAEDMGLNPYYMYRQKHMLGNLENIGYAKEGYECIYNMQIMEEKQSNYALGAGSITKFVYPDEDRIERVENVKNVEQYIQRVDEMIKRKYEEVEKNAK